MEEPPKTEGVAPSGLPTPVKPGTDPLYLQELLTIIQRGIDKHPRSAQALPGPSEIGGCERKLAWKMGYGGADGQPGGWASHKGTVMHKWLDWLINDQNIRLPNGTPRFLSDIKVQQIVPEVAGGTADLFDVLRGTVVDWKLPGDATMQKARAGNPSRGYYLQASVYGLGLQRMGFQVNEVAICFMPMAGDQLHGKAVLQSWPFSEEDAWAALRNAQRIKRMTEVAPMRRVLEILPTMSDFCQGCPVLIGNGDKRAMCPGATNTSRSVNTEVNPFAR